MKYYINYFKKYVNNYKNGSNINDKIKLKYEHSLRVYKNAVDFVKENNFDPRTEYIIKFVALFHDIGRFEQIKVYNTFDDRLSIDHAQLGNEILENKLLLKDFKPIEISTIKHAIFNHNKIDIEENLSDNELLHSKIIRDMDKLDIYRVFFKYYQKEFKGTHIKESLYNSIMNDIPIDYSESKDDTDMIVLKLSWVNDFNFPFTANKIKENKYFDRLIELLPNDKNTSNIKEKVLSILESKSTN